MLTPEYFWWWLKVALLRVADLDVVVTFRGKWKGNLSRLFVTSARDRSGFASKCRFRGRCRIFDMVVIFDAL